MILDHGLTDANATSFQTRDERMERAETLVHRGPAPGFGDTVFFVNQSSVPSTKGSVPRTLTTAELKQAVDADERSSRVSHSEDAIDRARDARVALLARKYEGVSTVEDEARIGILTQRLRKLLPRVTPGDVDALSTMVGELEAVSANLDAIRSKFGLK